MAGIVGLWLKQNNLSERTEKIKTMANAIQHRGSEKTQFFENDNGLSLGYNLSDFSNNNSRIPDFLSRFHVLIDGKIYNQPELKTKLEQFGHQFRTNTTEEIIALAFHQWGKECVHHFDGMFAIVVYDKKEDCLYCIRDRFGIKPFYYTSTPDGFIFASEMKALWSIGIRKELRPTMTYYYLIYDNVEDFSDNKNTFFESIFKIKPGHLIQFKPNKDVWQEQYYNPSTATTFKGSFDEAVEELRHLLKQSISRIIQGNENIGNSLSGGLDSSSITTMLNQLGVKTTTFSARFKDYAKDEGKFIDIVSNQFNTTQFNVFPKEVELIQELDQLLFFQEEPFETGSIFAQYKVYELAKQNNCSVLLDGQGADEVLAGYKKYLPSYYFELKNKPQKKNFVNAMMCGQGIDLKPTNLQYFHYNFPKAYSAFITSKNLLIKKQPKGIHPDYLKEVQNIPFIVDNSLKNTLKNSLMVQGLDKLMRFSDRNANAHGLTVAFPFLSLSFVDFFFSLPSEFFFKDGWVKSILRHAMNASLDKEIVWRKDKVGFEAPHDKWLRTNSMEESINQSHEFLVKEKIITNDYPKNWNTLVLGKIAKEK